MAPCHTWPSCVFCVCDIGLAEQINSTVLLLTTCCSLLLVKLYGVGLCHRYVNKENILFCKYPVSHSYIVTISEL